MPVISRHHVHVIIVLLMVGEMVVAGPPMISSSPLPSATDVTVTVDSSTSITASESPSPSINPNDSNNSMIETFSPSQTAARTSTASATSSESPLATFSVEYSPDGSAGPSPSPSDEDDMTPFTTFSPSTSPVAGVIVDISSSEVASTSPEPTPSESPSESSSYSDSISASVSGTPSETPTPSDSPSQSSIVHELTPEDIKEATEEEASMFLGIFCILIILVVGFLCVYYLRIRKLSWFPEAWVYFGIGLFMAMLVAVSGSPSLARIEDTIHASFGEIFFVVLLPPIIFESGYSMDKRPFFENFWSICMYAFLGTLLSMAVVGIMIIITSALAWHFPFSAIDALCFGSIISATDPVTVLAVFQELRVDRTLYSLVFGESVLNDAVAIVLYHTMLQFEATSVTFTSAFRGIFYFLENFIGSLSIGVVIGLLSALMFKFVRFQRAQAALERALITIVPFLAYMVSEGMQFSGVVAILFAGITMAHYTVRNLSSSTRRFSMQLFHTLAMVCESLVFVYIGVATPKLFSRVFGANWFFMFWIVAACLAGRAANVYTCTHILNKYRRDKITTKPAFVLWFSGLRGGVAFALSTSAKTVLPVRYVGEIMEVAALFIVVLSMLSIGGSIGPLVRKYDLCEDSPNRKLTPGTTDGPRISSAGSGGARKRPSRPQSPQQQPIGTATAPRQGNGWDVDATGMAVAVNYDADDNPGEGPRQKRTFWSAMSDLVVSALTIPPSLSEHEMNQHRRRHKVSDGTLSPLHPGSEAVTSADTHTSDVNEEKDSLLPAGSPVPFTDTAALISSAAPVSLEGVVGDSKDAPSRASSAAGMSRVPSRKSVASAVHRDSFYDVEGAGLGSGNSPKEDGSGEGYSRRDGASGSPSSDDEFHTGPVSWANMDSRFFTPFFTRSSRASGADKRGNSGGTGSQAPSATLSPGSVVSDGGEG